jgi:hypothetical protein
MTELLVWTTGEMTVTGESQSTHTKPVPLPFVHYKLHMDCPGVKPTPPW